MGGGYRICLGGGTLLGFGGNSSGGIIFTSCHSNSLLDPALAQLDHLLVTYVLRPLPLLAVEPVFFRSTLSVRIQLLLSSFRLHHLTVLALLIPLAPPPLLSPHESRNRNQRNQRNLLVLLLTFDQSAKPPKDSMPMRSTSSLEYLENVDARIG